MVIIIIGFPSVCIHSSTAEPAWNELIEIKPWVGFGQRSIADVIALHSPVDCDNFAALLLNDHLYVEATRRNNPKNDPFVIEVLRKWYSSDGLAVPCTWESLIECMKRAGLNPRMIKNIEENTRGKYDNIHVHHSIAHVCK